MLQNAFVTIVSNRRLLVQLQNVSSTFDLWREQLLHLRMPLSPQAPSSYQDHHTSLNALHQKHALVLAQAEAAASQFRAEADAAQQRVMAPFLC